MIDENNKVFFNAIVELTIMIACIATLFWLGWCAHEAMLSHDVAGVIYYMAWGALCFQRISA
jgi:hypothetical protein